MKLSLILTVSCLLWCSSVFSQQVARNPQSGVEFALKDWIHALPDTFDLFSDQKPLEFRLVSDFQHLVEKKFSEKYQDADLYILINDTLEIEKSTRIQPRGNFRMKNCTFPPLWLNFKNSTFYVPRAQASNKFKLVTECLRDSTFEIYVLREYLVYRMYNLLSPASLRVRMINITYEDNSGFYPLHASHAFIIEDIDDLADRLHGKELNAENPDPMKFSQQNRLTLSLFEYMIGNQDWSVAGMKNIKVIQLDESDSLLAVPYDFDYSGFVNTHYAEPKYHLGLETIRDRYYLGSCFDPELVKEVIRNFQAMEAEIKQEIASFGILDLVATEDLISYVDSFYRDLQQFGAGWEIFMVPCE